MKTQAHAFLARPLNRARAAVTAGLALGCAVILLALTSCGNLLVAHKTPYNGPWHWTDESAAGSRNWVAIASSADGSHLAGVVYGGDIWTSADSGATWSDQSAAGSRNWTSIASSADGTHLAAVDAATSSSYYGTGGDIWTSTDSGTTWTDHTSPGQAGWTSIASSADGTHLAAVEPGTGGFGGYVYTSTDSGATWTGHSAGGSIRRWESIASSADGTHLAAVESGSWWITGGAIWISTDSGETWTAQSAAGLYNWVTIASSSYGDHLTAVGIDVGGGDIWISSSGGGAWIEHSTSSSWHWGYAIVISADGTRIAATAFADGRASIYTSTNSGATWTYTGADLSDVSALASSADGSRLAATVYGGDIWVGAYR